MELLAGPAVETMPQRPTLGIRVRTPFRGMLGTRDQLLSELVDWIDERELPDLGVFFLRLHVVDMDGIMDLEVGVTDVDHPGDDRVRPGQFPAGQYATLTCRNHALRGIGCCSTGLGRTPSSWPYGPNPMEIISSVARRRI